uniref:Uncharacterized protein n=1 Tax=Cyprinus carpio TaxID=7962 RepID=A0A8C2GK78_CYPCA
MPHVWNLPSVCQSPDPLLLCVRSVKCGPYVPVLSGVVPRDFHEWHCQLKEMGKWDSGLDSFQKLLVLRCLRSERFTHGLLDFVASQLGQNFIKPQTRLLPSFIFVLSPGTDPVADLYKFAEVMKFSKKMSRLTENIDPDKVYWDFHLWLTSLPSNKFPVSVLQNGSKMTIEPPQGIKANLLRTYTSLTDEFIISCTKVHVKKNSERQHLFKMYFFFLTFKKKFNIGFNIPYEFTDGDLHICISQLKMFLDKYQNIPYKAKPDFLLPHTQFHDFYCPAVLGLMHTLFSPLHFKIIEEIVEGIVEKIPCLINAQEVMSKYPVMYEESVNTVLVREVIRYNKLLSVISRSLSDLVKALKDLGVMSSELELIIIFFFYYFSQAYPSLKPLASWVPDLVQYGIPAVFWISGFFFPQAFLTGTLQNFARSSSVSIDTIAFDFKVMKEAVAELTERPDIGCFIHSLYLEGARWDEETGKLAESQLFFNFPRSYVNVSLLYILRSHCDLCENLVCVLPQRSEKFCFSSTGTLSTTGHTTNYVIAVELPTDRTQGHRIKQGVTLICALDYKTQILIHT